MPRLNRIPDLRHLADDLPYPPRRDRHIQKLHRRRLRFCDHAKMQFDGQVQMPRHRTGHVVIQEKLVR